MIDNKLPYAIWCQKNYEAKERKAHRLETAQFNQDIEKARTGSESHYANKVIKTVEKSLRPKKRAKKIKRKSSRKTIKKKLTKAFNKSIRDRDTILFNGRCPLCPLRGTNNPIQDCGHWQTSAWESTKWDPENATGICKSCNIMMEHDSDFKFKCVKWYKAHYGEERWEAMVMRSHKPANFSKDDLKLKLDKIIEAK